MSKLSTQTFSKSAPLTTSTTPSSMRSVILRSVHACCCCLDFFHTCLLLYLRFCSFALLPGFSLSLGLLTTCSAQGLALSHVRKKTTRLSDLRSWYLCSMPFSLSSLSLIYCADRVPAERCAARHVLSSHQARLLLDMQRARSMSCMLHHLSFSMPTLHLHLHLRAHVASKEENEDVVVNILKKRPDFKLVPVLPSWPRRGIEHDGVDCTCPRLSILWSHGLPRLAVHPHKARGRPRDWVLCSSV